MIRISLLLILFIHGLIHLMGFTKAFQLAEIDQLTLPISKSAGIFWLIGCLLMLTSGVALLLKLNWWWAFALLGVVTSQILIIMSWQDAKFGTIANIIILIGILSLYFRTAGG